MIGVSGWDNRRIHEWHQEQKWGKGTGTLAIFSACDSLAWGKVSPNVKQSVGEDKSRKPSVLTETSLGTSICHHGSCRWGSQRGGASTEKTKDRAQPDSPTLGLGAFYM